MWKSISVCVLFAVLASVPLTVRGEFARDVIQTSAGDLEITFIGHGSLIFSLEGNIIHIDPFGRLADYGKLPAADMVFITHHHMDHLDIQALKKIRTGGTVIILTEECSNKIEGGIVMNNGDTLTVGGIFVEAIPAYNLLHKRSNGEYFHPKGAGNGYILTVGDTRIYIAGDTENTLEMKSLKNIDYAFLPMNLPYTMTPEMVADAAAAFKPKVLYPYHYGDTDTSQLVELLKDHDDVEVRIRAMN